MKARRDDGTEAGGHVTTDDDGKPVFVFEGPPGDGPYDWLALLELGFDEFIPENDDEARLLVHFGPLGRPRRKRTRKKSMAAGRDEDTSGREAAARSDFRAFLSSYRKAIFFQARNMHGHAGPHIAAAMEEGRYLLARLFGREVSEAEAESLIRFMGAADATPTTHQTTSDQEQHERRDHDRG
jgi:hypothetical protein